MKLSDRTFVLQESAGAAPVVAMITSCSGFSLQVEPPDYAANFAEPVRLIARVNLGLRGKQLVVPDARQLPSHLLSQYAVRCCSD